MADRAGTTPTILIVEDDAGVADLEARRLRRAGMKTTIASNLAETKEHLSSLMPALILIDYVLPDGHAGDLLDWVREHDLDVPVVVVTGNGDEHIAVEMMKWGARDYLVKGSQTLDLLPEVVDRVLEQQRLRTQLREAEERYQFIVNQTLDVITLIEFDGIIRFASPACDRVTGYSPEEVVGTAAREYVHPDDIDRLRPREQWIAAGRFESSPVELRIRTKAGNWLWVEMVARPFMGEQGVPSGIVASIRDISERKAGEQFQRAYTELLEAVGAVRQIGTEPDGDLKGQLAHLLGRMTEILRVDAAAIFLREGDWMVPYTGAGRWGNPPAHWRTAIGDGYGGTVAKPDEWLDLHGDDIQLSGGAWLKGSDSASLLGVPLKGRADVLGMMHFGSAQPRRFTESERSLLAAAASRCALVLENAHLRDHLSASEARYRELVESSPEIVWMTALDGTITFVNAAVERILGYTPEEVIGRSGGEFLFHGQELEQILRQFLSAPRVDRELVLPSRDGQTVVLHITAFVRRGPQGELSGLAGFARDVTVERRLENQLRQSQKLEAVGRLAGGIAHDFNNLLTGIMGSAQILREEVEADSPLVEDLEIIIAGVNRAAGLTRQLLAFSRRQPMEFGPVHLNNVVQDMSRLIERTIGEDITVILQLSDSPATVMADAGQTEQVLLNLCLNARDAMPDGGELTIATAEVEITPELARAEPWARPGRYVRLTVGDTGTGIPESIRSRIFEPYFSTKADGGRGTGLGLATVHGIVTQHEGLIQVESESETGTRFHIYLPVTDMQPKIDAPAEHPVAGEGSECILVAEDEAPVRRLIQRVLTAKGYQVVEAADGWEAVREFKARPGAFNLVMLDVVMPVMNGREAMEAIRSVRGDIPILFMSGYAKDVLGENLATLGNPAFLQKPFTPSELAHQVRSVISASERDESVTGGT